MAFINKFKNITNIQKFNNFELKNNSNKNVNNMLKNHLEQCVF